MNKVSVKFGFIQRRWNGVVGWTGILEESHLVSETKCSPHLMRHAFCHAQVHTQFRSRQLGFPEALFGDHLNNTFAVLWVIHICACNRGRTKQIIKS